MPTTQTWFVVGAVTFVVAAVLLGSEEIRALPGLLLKRR